MYKNEKKHEKYHKVVIHGAIDNKDDFFRILQAKSLSSSQNKPTIGVDFQLYTIDIGDTTHQFQLWDVVTESNSRFSTMIKVYLKKAEAVLFVDGEEDQWMTSILDKMENNGHDKIKRVSLEINDQTDIQKINNTLQDCINDADTEFTVKKTSEFNKSVRVEDYMGPVEVENQNFKPIDTAKQEPTQSEKNTAKQENTNTPSSTLFLNQKFKKLGKSAKSKFEHIEESTKSKVEKLGKNADLWAGKHLGSNKSSIGPQDDKSPIEEQYGINNNL